MASAAEIRAWARAQGLNVADAGRPSGSVRRKFDEAHRPPDDDDPFADGGGGDDDFTSADEPPQDHSARPDRAAAEAAAAEARAAAVDPPDSNISYRSGGKPRAGRPRPPSGPGWRDRLFGGGGRAAPAAGKPRARTAAARKPPPPRVPLARMVSAGWSGLAKAAEQVNLPLGRILKLQAPTAGLMFDDAFRGSVVDRALQPFARAQERGETVSALVGPPVLILALQAQPAAAPVLIPILRSSLASMIRLAGPKAAQQAAEDAAWEAEHGPEVDAYLAGIFAGVPGFDPAAGPFEGTPERAQWEAQAEAERAANGGPPPGAKVVSMILQPFGGQAP